MGKSSRILALLFIFLILCSSPVFPASISGSAHYWDTLEPASQMVFSINTTPVQTIVSLEGAYSFTVGPGTYAVSAKKMEKGQVSFEDSSEITVLSDVGEYRIDFILFPSDDYFSEELDFSGENEGLVELPKEGAPENSSLAIIPALLAGAFLIAFIANRKNSQAFSKGATKRSPKGKQTKKRLPRESPKGTPKEAEEILRIIREAGGRMSQRDLRKALPYSEAKASLIVSELDARGIVKKYKRGRTNLLVLSEAYR